MPRLAVFLFFLLGVVGTTTAALAVDGAQPPANAVSAYRLGADDKVRISVYGEEALSGEFPVGSDGQLSFPLLGMIRAGGLTVAEFQAALAAALAGGYLQDPKVSVAISEYRPFYILGEVNKPGQYPYRTNMTVMAAVATAGGYTYRANKKRVFVKHADESEEHEYRLTGSSLVRPGDTIRIGERYF